jgi:D-alanyl-D-alanine carboxypeptidase
MGWALPFELWLVPLSRNGLANKLDRMLTKSDTARRVGVAVVVGAAVVALAGTAVAEYQPITDVRAVQAQLDQVTGAGRIPGALAQVRDRRGRSVTITSGTAELGTGRPMVGGDGRFRIASVTKSFVAVAVLQLVARQRIRLDASVETYLPGVVRGTGEGSQIDGRAITVRQLLQHTSGLPDYVPLLDPGELDRPVEAAELVRIALSQRPPFSPGEGWKYSNTGYVLAGMIVERLTHKDIGTAVTELVIRPAHLRDTYWPPAGEVRIRGPHAHNYTVDKADPAGPLVDVTEVEPSWAGASGAMVSTPSDLNRFWQQLFGGRLLPRWALTEMQNVVPAPGLGEDMFYGLGLIRVPLSCGGQIWAHGGDLHSGGVANISGQDDSGRAATAYVTALTGGSAAGQLLRVMETALC